MLALGHAPLALALFELRDPVEAARCANPTPTPTPTPTPNPNPNPNQAACCARAEEEA